MWKSTKPHSHALATHSILVTVRKLLTPLANGCGLWPQTCFFEKTHLQPQRVTNHERNSCPHVFVSRKYPHFSLISQPHNYDLTATHLSSEFTENWNRFFWELPTIWSLLMAIFETNGRNVVQPWPQKAIPGHANVTLVFFKPHTEN